jgi:predicted PhzF superfamily epimerase YddE/YHI9
VLWTEGHVAADNEIRFHSRSGLLRAARRDSLIELDFPATPALPVSAPAGLLDSLGIRGPVAHVGRNRFDYLVELPSEAEVRAVQPDFARLAHVEARGVIVTSRSASEAYDFVSRFFAPAAGVNEDPVRLTLIA